MKRIFFFFFFFTLTFAKDKEQKVLQEFIERKGYFNYSASVSNISPRIIVSIIYAERLRNYNWDDAVLDDITARTGYNSSIGFAQIKITTAFWIEEQVNTPASKYYLGKEVQSIVHRSRAREELIDRLNIDSISILYCSLYAAMIKKRWDEAGFHFTVENESGILGTLYSLGIIRSNGEERLPLQNSTSNDFGKTAQKFYNSFVLRNMFQ